MQEENNNQDNNQLGNDTKPLLCAGLNGKQTTRIERTLFDIFDKYHITPSIQNKLAVEILKACDAELDSR
jgi:hypothetical protein